MSFFENSSFNPTDEEYRCEEGRAYWRERELRQGIVGISRLGQDIWHFFMFSWPVPDFGAQSTRELRSLDQFHACLPLLKSIL